MTDVDGVYLLAGFLVRYWVTEGHSSSSTMLMKSFMLSRAQHFQTLKKVDVISVPM